MPFSLNLTARHKVGRETVRKTMKKLRETGLAETPIPGPAARMSVSAATMRP